MERERRLAPFVQKSRRPEVTEQAPPPTEWREQTPRGIRVYKRIDSFVRVYDEADNYLPHESLDYGHAEMRKTLRPLSEDDLNFVVTNQR